MMTPIFESKVDELTERVRQFCDEAEVADGADEPYIRAQAEAAIRILVERMPSRLLRLAVSF